MRILFVTADIGWPLSYGGEIRRWNVLQGLLKAGETDAVVFRNLGVPISREAFAGCGRLIEVDNRHMRKSARDEQLYESTIGRAVLALTRRLPFEYLGSDQEKLSLYLEQQLDGVQYHVVWIATARFAARIDHTTFGTTILDGDDFAYVREWLLLRNSPWYGSKIWNYCDVAKLWWRESRLHRRFSFVVRCSPEDYRRHPAPNVVVIPNGARVPPTIDRAIEKRLLFVGEMAYEPNSQGLEWFLRAVWPEIRAREPEASFDIVGRNPSPEVRAADGRDGVVVHGFVKDLGPLYARAAATVVPLFAGGGTRLKIIESLAHGVPTVSTDLGAFGIDLREEHGLIRADAAELFAAACLRVIGEEDAEIQANAVAGREAVKARYDWAAIQLQVRDLVGTSVRNARVSTSGTPASATGGGV